MDYSTIVEVYSTSSEKEANTFLSHGWLLLTIRKTTYDYKIAPNDQTVHYVLGRPFNVSYTLEQFENERSSNSSFRTFSVPDDQ